MKKFSDFKINVSKPMAGEKIKISKILNREIIVTDYKITDSKYQKNKSGKCLCFQINFGDEKRVVFTGSDVLINQIKYIDKSELPFETIIIQEGDHYEFQ